MVVLMCLQPKRVDKRLPTGKPLSITHSISSVALSVHAIAENAWRASF